jgi:hypothetical protein
VSAVELVFRPPLAFIERQHGAFRRQLEDLTGLWRRFIPLIVGMEEAWFASHGEGVWPPLAQSTLDRKRARGYSEEPLRTDDRQGSLYNTLIDPQLAADINPGFLVWSTGVPYAHFHQDGGTVPGRPPRRQVIPDPLPLNWRRQFEAATVSWLNEAAAIAFGSLR